MPLRTLVYFVIHVVIAILIWKILEWLIPQLDLGIPSNIVTLIAILIALVYFGGGWFYYDRRGRPIA